MSNVTNCFDFANAPFIASGDGQWTLDRDWTKHPPTQFETEVLFAHIVRLDRLVSGFIRHYVAGRLVEAEGTDAAARDKLKKLFTSVGETFSPPAGGSA
jgi:hypothetical protein